MLVRRAGRPECFGASVRPARAYRDFFIGHDHVAVYDAKIVS
jgi:hypothetical protein